MISRCESCNREFIVDDDSYILYMALSETSHSVCSMCNDCKNKTPQIALRTKKAFKAE